MFSSLMCCGRIHIQFLGEPLYSDEQIDHLRKRIFVSSSRVSSSFIRGGVLIHQGPNYMILSCLSSSSLMHSCPWKLSSSAHCTYLVAYKQTDILFVYHQICAMCTATQFSRTTKRLRGTLPWPWSPIYHSFSSLVAPYIQIHAVWYIRDGL